MSRWLQSVNSLLENLDGQAETVAGSGDNGDGGTSGGLLEGGMEKILEQGREAVRRTGLQQQQQSFSDDSYDEESYDDGEEDNRVLAKEDDDEALYDEYTTDGDDYIEEAVVDGTFSVETSEGGLITEDDGQQQGGAFQDALDATSRSEDAISIHAHHRKQRRSSNNTDGGGGGGHDGDTVSEISCDLASAADDDVLMEGLRQKNHDAKSSPNSRRQTTKQVPPPPPPQNQQQQALPSHGGSTPTSPSKPKSLLPPLAATTTATATTIARLSPKSQHSLLTDQSPRQPRRSVDDTTTTGQSPRLGLPVAGAGYLEDASTNNSKDGDADPSTVVLKSDDSIPPRQPQRKSSGSAAKAPIIATTSSTTVVASNNNNNSIQNLPSSPQLRRPTTTSKPPPHPPMETATTRPAVHPTKTKEYAKLLKQHQAMQKENQSYKQELKTLQVESQQATKRSQSLTVQLDTANSEIEAQAEELRRAGERMEKDRLRAQEEREDLMDDHDDEMDNLKESQEKETTELRSQYETQIAALTLQLDNEQRLRTQEGGDASNDLQDAIVRERDAIKKLSTVENDKRQLESTVSKLETQQTALNAKLESALQSGKTASDREREVEDKLDASSVLHAQQLRQRQTREAELEKTILELGAALTVARQQTKSRGTQPLTEASNDDKESFKEKYNSAAEELETLKVRYMMETQRREALQEEFNEISKERTNDASSAQAKQMQYDRKVADLESSLARLQASLSASKANRTLSNGNGDSSGGQSTGMLSEAKLEIGRLSEQLVRHQRSTESSKTEILTLKSRLKACQTRAEEAEASLVTAQSSNFGSASPYDIEGGPSQSHLRRRVKGGRRARGGGVSIRSALQLGPGSSHSPFLDQVAQTLDAIDTWMVDTGSFMRHEPFARLGFLLYLLILHTWTFAMVAFHETEIPHGDFGSMGNNPRHWRDHASP